MHYLADAIWAPIWFAVTCLLAYACWAVSQRLFPADRGMTRIGHVVVLGWAQVILASVALGAFNLLTPAWLLTLVASLATLTLLMSKVLKSDAPEPSANAHAMSPNTQ